MNGHTDHSPQMSNKSSANKQWYTTNGFYTTIEDDGTIEDDQASAIFKWNVSREDPNRNVSFPHRPEDDRGIFCKKYFVFAF